MPEPKIPRTTALVDASLVPLTDAERSAELRGLLRRVAVGLLGFFLGVLVLARLFREPLRALGATFVHRFGLAGVFLGTFVADAFTFPIPPQFYLLTVITSGRDPAAPVLSVLLASVLAGLAGYCLAGRLAELAVLRRLLEHTREQVDRIFSRWGPWAVVIAGISPLPFSGLCYAAGLYRMPPRLFAMLLTLRVPRLLMYYAALRAGWSL
ncbi:MAG: VTT domain-containing protein [Myxococcales bacterium]|nr:VTT domain-containing protein [Polyangiaceae bacterium]MDW8247769.1 VTT domain-containing protein [Myxococcales bacterium]